ncbi:MAG: AAA family ATPase [Alphaproteobacteria bacterium]|nr:AAA family ATPase [Alphaproteobacteria bacterium]
MKIKSVTINNFRSIQHAKIDFHDYSIIVGENNVGKSNIIDAIRYFYGDLELTMMDWCLVNEHEPFDVSVEVEYDISPQEYNNLPTEYRIHQDKLCVRKEIDLSTVDMSKPFKSRYVCPGANQSDRPIEDFLGNIIYIPSGDDMRHTYKSISDKLSESIRKRIEMTKLPYNFLVKHEFSRIEQKIANEIQMLGIQPDISFNSRLPQMQMSLHVEEGYGLTDLTVLSTGTQRRVIAGLIKINAQLNEMLYGIHPTVLLYEEPEAYMHPNAIADLAYDLRGFARIPNQQVIATTHSGHLVAEDIMDMCGLIRVDKQNGLTRIHQNKIPASELELAKNLVYFDRPRSDIFFANKVVLVEGPTEYNLYNYLKKRGDLPHSLTRDVTLIDSIGKWPMPYFQKILNSYNIHHSVLYDTDGNPNRPDNIAVRNEFSELTDYSYGFPRDIETFCGIKKSGNPAINIINKFEDGTVTQEKQAEVVEIFKNLIMQKQK